MRECILKGEMNFLRFSALQESTPEKSDFSISPEEKKKRTENEKTKEEEEKGEGEEGEEEEGEEVTSLSCG
jgi:hypothetical protein